MFGASVTCCGEMVSRPVENQAAKELHKQASTADATSCSLQQLICSFMFFASSFFSVHLARSSFHASKVETSLISNIFLSALERVCLLACHIGVSSESNWFTSALRLFACSCAVLPAHRVGAIKWISGTFQALLAHVSRSTCA